MKPILAVTVCVLLLSACAPGGGGAPSGSPTSSETATATATPTPTPTEDAAPTGKPSLGELVLSPEGLGPIVIGSPIPAAAADVAVALWDPTFCDWDDPASDHGGWKPNYPMTPVNGNFPFYPESGGTTPDAPILWIAVISDEIHTAEGLGVGSTIAAVQAQYGAALQVVPTPNATAYVVQGVHGELIFWGDGSTVGPIDVFPAGAAPELYYEIGGCA
jgi:hypothetical protein